MGANDDREMLEAAKEECGRLERENADLRMLLAEATESINAQIERGNYLARRLAKKQAQRDAARAVIAAIQNVVDDERIPDQVHGDDWILAENLTAALLAAYPPVSEPDPAQAVTGTGGGA